MKPIASLARSLAVAILVLGSYSGFASAAPSVVYVGKTNCSDTATNAGNNSHHPFCTIQKGINTVNNGGTVKVDTGTYTEPVLLNKPIKLLGAQTNHDPILGRTTPSRESIISGPGVTITADNTTLDGFTISDNTGGPGITTSADHSGYHIEYNVIAHNVMGLYFSSNDKFVSTVGHNRFDSNTQEGAASGNGVYADQGANNATFKNNAFVGNTNADFAFLSTSSSVTNNRLQFSFNTHLGSGAFLLLINGRNDTFSHNTGTGFAGSSAIFLGGSDSHVTLSQNNLTGDTSDDTKNAFSGIRITLDQVNYGNPDFTLVPNNVITVEHNTIQNFGDAGISVGNPDLESPTLTNSTISHNTTLNNGTGEQPFDAGILVRASEAGLTISHNTMHNNDSFDAADYSTGSGTANTANTWDHNVCETSTPTGLCQAATSDNNQRS